MTAPKQAEAVMTSIPKFVSSIPEKPVAECNPLLFVFIYYHLPII